MASSAESDPLLLPVVTAALSDRHHVIVGSVDVPAGWPGPSELEIAAAEAVALRHVDRVHRVSGTEVRVVVVDPLPARAGERFDAFVARLTGVEARQAVVSCCEVRADEDAVALLARLDTLAQRRRDG